MIDKFRLKVCNYDQLNPYFYVSDIYEYKPFQSYVCHLLLKCTQLIHILPCLFFDKYAQNMCDIYEFQPCI